MSHSLGRKWQAATIQLWQVETTELVQHRHGVHRYQYTLHRMENPHRQHMGYELTSLIFKADNK
jgi:hypothetical protein